MPVRAFREHADLGKVAAPGIPTCPRAIPCQVVPMNSRLIAWVCGFLTLGGVGGGLTTSPVLGEEKSEGSVLFEADFSDAKVGMVPDGFLVLQGLFAVVESDEETNKYLELPGAPLETFGVLFGPSKPHGVELQARIRATRDGRKFPVFMAGLNGNNGYKIRVLPGRNGLQLTRGEEVLESGSFRWQSGEWAELRLRVIAESEGVRVLAKVWQGEEEPTEWTIQASDSKPMPSGKAGVWGLPFSGTPLQFDDLRIVEVEPVG